MSLNGYKIQRGNWTLTMLHGKGSCQLLEIWTLIKVCELVARQFNDPKIGEGSTTH